MVAAAQQELALVDLVAVLMVTRAVAWDQELQVPPSKDSAVDLVAVAVDQTKALEEAEAEVPWEETAQAQLQARVV